MFLRKSPLPISWFPVPPIGEETDQLLSGADLDRALRAHVLDLTDDPSIGQFVR
jgi:hypothetical protein